MHELESKLTESERQMQAKAERDAKEATPFIPHPFLFFITLKPRVE